MLDYFHVTPCCKSRHWHTVNRSDIPKGVVRCELCDKLHDFENLLTVKRGFNPVTYFCDKCHKSVLEEYNEEKLLV